MSTLSLLTVEQYFAYQMKRLDILCKKMDIFKKNMFKEFETKFLKPTYLLADSIGGRMIFGTSGGRLMSSTKNVIFLKK